MEAVLVVAAQGMVRAQAVADPGGWGTLAEGVHMCPDALAVAAVEQAIWLALRAEDCS